MILLKSDWKLYAWRKLTLKKVITDMLSNAKIKKFILFEH